MNEVPTFHRHGPLTWWGYEHERSPHRHVKLRVWRVEVHVEAWINRYPLSSSRWCFRVGGFYDRKHGNGYAARREAS